MADSTTEKQRKAVSFRREMDGMEPVTDYDSKTVMMAAERGDQIDITEIVNQFTNSVLIPSTVSVIKRTETYYGPELFVHATFNGTDHNFLLNAPGPDTHLCLWAGDTTEDNKREGWFAAAEIKASLSAEQPPYEHCGQCGELIRTIEHARQAEMGDCSRSDTWK